MSSAVPVVFLVLPVSLLFDVVRVKRYNAPSQE